MLGRLWQQLVRLFQHSVHLFQVGKPQPAESCSETTPMSDVAYELLFMRILDRVEGGWNRLKSWPIWEGVPVTISSSLGYSGLVETGCSLSRYQITSWGGG